MKFGIIGNTDKQSEVLSVFYEFAEWILAHGASIILEENFYSILTDKDNFDFLTMDELVEASDIIITMGGDGTILSTARLIGFKEKPILGFHLGNLGFLAEITRDTYKEKLKQIIQGKYFLDKRMVIKADVINKDESYRMYALNDIVISKGLTPRMIRFFIEVDGDFMNSYHSDGVIIASPTGSTAYSLSSSGPILTPDLNAVVINPICPHSLTNRPIVLNANRSISVKFDEISEGCHITADGQMFNPLTVESEIRISKAEFSINLVRLEDHNFFKVLHNKLGWGS